MSYTLTVVSTLMICVGSIWFLHAISIFFRYRELFFDRYFTDMFTWILQIAYLIVSTGLLGGGLYIWHMYGMI